MSNESSDRKRALAESFSKTVLAIDQRAEADFIDSVIAQVSTPLKRIPEPVFREIFLPYFTGEKTPTPENDAIAHWIGIVGSATESAEVVNVKGDVLFEVPPMYDSSRINPIKGEKNTNFATIFTVFEEQARVHPSLGRDYLAETLSEKADKNILKNNGKGPSWVPVLQYYKLLPDEAVKAATPAATPGDDDLSFDDN